MPSHSPAPVDVRSDMHTFASCLVDDVDAPASVKCWQYEFGGKKLRACDVVRDRRHVSLTVVECGRTEPAQSTQDEVIPVRSNYEALLLRDTLLEALKQCP